MTRAVLQPVDRWAGTAPNFNRQAAEVVYKAMTSMDADEAVVFGNILVEASMNYDLMGHYDDIVVLAQQGVSKRATALRNHYTREAVAKERRGQDSSHEIRCLVEIGKAFDFTTGQRSQYSRQNAQGRTREGGRFAQEHRPIITDDGQAPRDPHLAEQMGIPKTDLEGEDRSHYQQAYQQIRDMVGPYRGADLNALLHLNVENKTSGVTTTHALPIERGKTPDIKQRLNQGDRIRTAAVSINPKVSAPSAVFGAMSGIGVPDARAGHIAGAFEGMTGPALRDYNTAAGQPFKDNEPYSAGARAFGHMGRGAELLQQGLGDNAPRQLQYALAVANHVGQFGPEAQKVIGPIADRTAYRYRGTERAPSRRLMAAFHRLHGDSQLRDAADRKEAAVAGLERPEGWDPMPVLRYFHDHLPNPDLNELQRRSGVIPPSEGIIINREGKVAHQSVGYADDWYLPFNLKHLGSLKGGEYIRTRTFGGPTTEDIYAGLVSGARSITVVSHNGVYNMELDRNLRGGRRLNDKAARMVSRYGQLLDALRSRQVARGDISPSRMREIRAKLDDETNLEPNSKEWNAELDKRKASERLSPLMSKEERDTAALGWLQSHADRQKTAHGGVMTVDELYGEAIKRSARSEKEQDRATAAAAGVASPFTDELFARRAAERLIVADDRTATAANVAEAYGPRAQENYKRYMERAERDNAERISPLSLNGKGYDDALHALQEQFPYYIENVTFRPWTEAIGMGDNAHRGKVDTGYVLPRHNRPEGAQSGYFSPDVYGEAEPGSKSGKVRADTTRYQNRRVHAKPVAIRTDETKEAQGTAGVKMGPSGRVGAPTPEGQRTVADLDMLDELRDKTKFESGAEITSNGVTVNLSGMDITTGISNPLWPSSHAAVKTFFEKPKSELQSALMDPAKAQAVRDMMTSLLTMSTGPKKLFDIKDATKQNFLNQGKAQAAKEVPALPLNRLNELEDDHLFPGAAGAFNADRQPTVEAVLNAYGDDKAIKNAAARRQMPALDPAKLDEFDSKIKEVVEGLRGEIVDYNRGIMNGAPANRAVDQNIDNDTLAVMHAKQLRRRLKEAVQNAPKPPDPAPEPVVQTSVQQHLHVAGMTPAEIAAMPEADWQAFLRRTGQASNTVRPHQIINPNP